jgi:hypothetical protein
MPVVRQWLSSDHVMAATDMHAATTEELLEAVPSVWSVPGLYDEDQLPIPVSQERVCRQTISWEAGTWGWGQFGNPQKGEYPLLEAATKQRSEDCDWEHYLLFVWQWYVSVLKQPINLITNPNPVHSHSITWQCLLTGDTRRWSIWTAAQYMQCTVKIIVMLLSYCGCTHGQIHAYINTYTLNSWFQFSTDLSQLIRKKLDVFKQKLFCFYAKTIILLIHKIWLINWVIKQLFPLVQSSNL